MSLAITPSSPFLATDEQSVGLFPPPSELTVAQAAKLIDAKEGYINELLQTGRVVFRQENGIRLIRQDSLLEYEQDRDRRHAKLNEMVRWDQEMGLYDD